MAVRANVDKLMQSLVLVLGRLVQLQLASLSLIDFCEASGCFMWTQKTAVFVKNTRGTGFFMQRRATQACRLEVRPQFEGALTPCLRIKQLEESFSARFFFEARLTLVQHVVFRIFQERLLYREILGSPCRISYMQLHHH